MPESPAAGWYVLTVKAKGDKLDVNKEYRGVYVNVERIDESFLASHLPDASGALFKVNQGDRGPTSSSWATTRPSI